MLFRSGHRPAALVPPDQKGFQMGSDGAVQKTLRRVARPISRRGVHDEGIAIGRTRARSPGQKDLHAMRPGEAGTNRDNNSALIRTLATSSPVARLRLAEQSRDNAPDRPGPEPPKQRLANCTFGTALQLIIQRPEPEAVDRRCGVG